jgi:hypothetical protein
MNLLNIIGAIGSFLFAAACIPMAASTVYQGDAVVKDRATIWIFVFATLFFGVYLVGKTGINIPSLTIFVEWVCWMIVAKYSYFPDYERQAELVLAASPSFFQKGDPNAQFCTRRGPHEGPCNGLERSSCRVRD